MKSSEENKCASGKQQQNAGGSKLGQATAVCSASRATVSADRRCVGGEEKSMAPKIISASTSRNTTTIKNYEMRKRNKMTTETSSKS